MPLTENVIKKISEDTGIEVDELSKSALLALLREKRRKLMIEKAEILSRYNVKNMEELEDKIKRGEIHEHPSWEDLIVLENLEDILARLNEDMDAIQQTS
ncbi:MAG: hypothetical protein OHK0032_02970 [Thermodesulfovibrionales bacterium]